MDRRYLLWGVALLVVGTTGGCSALGDQRTAVPSGGAQSSETATAGSETGTRTGTTTSTADAELRSAPDVYISEVLANPEGSDEENLDEEYVLVEVGVNTEVNLSGYTLSYGQRREYAFPDIVDAVGSEESVKVVSGEGSNRRDEPPNQTYTLFLGSDEPLLDNDGMRLTLRDAAGETVDSVDYWAMDAGSLYVRPET